MKKGWIRRSSPYLVGVTGFEPVASSSRTMRAAGLRYTPKAIDYTRCAPIVSKRNVVSCRRSTVICLTWAAAICYNCLSRRSGGTGRRATFRA